MLGIKCDNTVRRIGIVLPSEFRKIDVDEVFDLAYTDGALTVGMTRISFGAVMDIGLSPNLSARELAEFYRDNSAISKNVFDYGDTVYFTYLKSDGDIEYRYIPTFYTTPYAYFIITFITPVIGGWDLESALSLTNRVYLVPGMY